MVQTGLWTSNGVTRSYSTHAFLCALATVMLNIGTLLIGGAAVVSDGTCTHCTCGRDNYSTRAHKNGKLE